jgi:rRNA pseudouridine-1189 N-methylase Emg1 (Nep1/Mra1 family)
MATRLEERIGGRLQPDIVHQVFEEMRDAPVKAASQMIAHRMNLVLEVLDDDRKRSVVWSCIQAWFEV